MVVVHFIHPDLGIGGAERLVVDAAVGLQSAGATVRVYTSHHNRNHCFPETIKVQGRNDTLDVEVHGDFIPRSTFGRMQALWAYLRMVYLSLWVILRAPRADVVFIDTISIAVPFFRWLTGARVVFYCHHPDSVLCANRNSFLMRVYRRPIDFLEEWSTRQAHKILVNSQYTQRVFHETFGSIRALPEVLYPSINAEAVASALESSGESGLDPTSRGKRTILSINRFEGKKNIGLALQAFHQVLGGNPANFQLVIMGGYDERVTENRLVLGHLQALASELGYKHFTRFRGDDSQPAYEPAILFLPSAPLDAKWSYLKTCEFLVYTPDNEHFGIVPIEAMFAERPVVAVCSGGPLESICDGTTGFLCAPNPPAFASAFRNILGMNEKERRAMGEAGKRRVESLFTLSIFTNRLRAFCGLQ